MFQTENVPAAENTRPDGKAAAAAAVATDREIRAVTAEREIEALYVALYMADKVGETFDGAVSSVPSQVRSFSFFSRTFR